MSDTVKELRKIETAFAKLRNNLNRADLDYTVQVSISSTDPRHVAYACWLTPPADGLMPIRILGESADDLIAKIKAATKKIDYTAVEIAYHEAQILACDRTKQGHQDRIDELKAEIAGESEEEVATEDSEKPTEEQ